LELCIICREALLVMGSIVMLFTILELKKKKILQSMEKIICCGIKDSGILERISLKYYIVKLFLNIWPISLCIFISVNIIYMGSRIR
jgi:hypothetical protein